MEHEHSEQEIPNIDKSDNMDIIVGEHNLNNGSILTSDNLDSGIQKKVAYSSPETQKLKIDENENSNQKEIPSNGNSIPETKNNLNSEPVGISSKPKSSSKNLSKKTISQPIRRPTMSRDDLKQCGSIIKAMRRHPDAGPFLEPVDYIKLGLSDYPTIIHRPMDIDTIDKKLIVCEYNSVDEFFADMQQIFDNCYLYNGRDAPVSIMASNLEKSFNKYKRDFSHATELLEQGSHPHRSQESKTVKHKTKPRQPSRKNSHSNGSHSHKEAHFSRRTSSKTSMPIEHFEFAQNVLRELFNKKHSTYSFPFVEPVDWVAMGIPDYPEIIRHPMDLSTVKHNLDSNKYSTLDEMGADIHLIFNNCYTYNPPSGQVYLMGKKLETVFEKKWEARRHIKVQSTNDGLSSDETSDEEPAPVKPKSHKSSNDNKKNTKTSKKRPEPEHKSRESNGTLNSKGNNDKSSKKNPVITWHQKRDLSLAINDMDGNELKYVIQVISQSMPGIIDANQPIELDIDALDSATLLKLYNRIVKKQNDEPNKPNKMPKVSHSSNHGSGHLNQQAAHAKDKKIQKHSQLSSSSSSSSSGSNSDSSSGSSSSDSSGVSDKRKHIKLIPSLITKKIKQIQHQNERKPDILKGNERNVVRIQALPNLIKQKSKLMPQVQARSLSSTPKRSLVEPKFQSKSTTNSSTPVTQSSTTALSSETIKKGRQERLARQQARDEEIVKQVVMRKKQIEDEIKKCVEADRESRVALKVKPMDLMQQTREIAKFEEKLKGLTPEEYQIKGKKFTATIENRYESSLEDICYPKPPTELPPPLPVESIGNNSFLTEIPQPPIDSPPPPPIDNIDTNYKLTGPHYSLYNNPILSHHKNSIESNMKENKAPEKSSFNIIPSSVSKKLILNQKGKLEDGEVHE